MELIFPWKMEGTCADGTHIVAYGDSEELSMYSLIEKSEKHGGLAWYSGACDEYYQYGECMCDYENEEE